MLKNILYIHGIASHGNDHISTEIKKNTKYKVFSPTFSPNAKKTKKKLKKILKKDWDLIITFSFGSIVLNSILNKKYKKKILMINPIFKTTKHLKEGKKIPDFSTSSPTLYKIKKREKRMVRRSIKNGFNFKNQYMVYSQNDELTNYQKIKKTNFKKVWKIDEKHNIKDVNKILKVIKKMESL